MKVKDKNVKILKVTKVDEVLANGFTEEGLSAFVVLNCGIPVGYLKKLYANNRHLFNATIKHFYAFLYN